MSAENRSCRLARTASAAEHEKAAGAEDVAEGVVEAAAAPADGKWRRPAVLWTKADAPEELASSTNDVVAAAARFIVSNFLVSHSRSLENVDGGSPRVDVPAGHGPPALCLRPCRFVDPSTLHTLSDAVEIRREVRLSSS